MTAHNWQPVFDHGAIGANVDRCALCGTDDKGRLRKVQPPSVPTISYLKPEEWQRA